MNKKKGEVNQIFVFVFSIIIIAFCAFLVIKFVGSFIGDTNQKWINDFYSELDKNYKNVYTTYGSEKVFEYKLASPVQFVCFIADDNCIGSLDSSDISDTQKESMNAVFSGGDNVLMLDQDDVINSRKLDSFFIDSPGCFCAKLNSADRFKLVFENRKNKVYIGKVE